MQQRVLMAEGTSPSGKSSSRALEDNLVLCGVTHLSLWGPHGQEKTYGEMGRQQDPL